MAAGGTLVAGSLPLEGRVAVVTGVSRRIGIGYGVARRLADDGADLFLQSWTGHDEEMPWGADEIGIEGVIDAIRSEVPEGRRTKSLASALSRRGITVTCINPGATDTGYADDLSRQLVIDDHPQHRWGTPADAARLIAWLVSDEAAWITGQVINSDGGSQL